MKDLSVSTDEIEKSDVLSSEFSLNIRISEYRHYISLRSPGRGPEGALQAKPRKISIP